MNSIFLSWTTGLVLAGITMFSPIALNNNSRANEVIEEDTALEGCATNFENQNLTPFYYDGPNYLQVEVEKPSNWKLATPAHSCKTGNVLACMIFADEDHVDDPDNPTALNPDIDIQASSSTNSYVLSVASSSTFSNRGM